LQRAAGPYIRVISEVGPRNCNVRFTPRLADIVRLIRFVRKVPISDMAFT
jgi:hypothetical protein